MYITFKKQLRYKRHRASGLGELRTLYHDHFGSTHVTIKKRLKRLVAFRTHGPILLGMAQLHF